MKENKFFKAGRLSRFNLIYIFFFTSFIVFSKTPIFPYYFNAPDFDSLLPFSMTELQKFKDIGINKVETITNYFRTIYYLNENGQLTSKEEFWVKKKKEILVNTTIYKYNNNGKLTSRYETGKRNIYYDSLAYDDKGRITHYSSYSKPLKRRNKNQLNEIRYNLQLILSYENKVVLIDSSSYNLYLYTLYNNNNVQLIKSLSRTDSVSIEYNSDSEYTKKYWYKNNNETIYKVGQEFTYKNGVIQTKTLWDEVGYGKRIIYKTYYTYDQLNRLLRTENEYKYQPKTFYTYYDFGLPMEQITIYMNSSTISEFRYWFTKKRFDL